jgi:hypothetical protein
MNINSANEYWVKAGSMLHSTSTGADLPDAVNFRTYLISGSQHGGPGAANSLGVCAQFVNSTDQFPALRALFGDLDQWIDGTAPPDSAMPKVADGTAVFATVNPATEAIAIGSVSQIALGFPTIPGLNYDGLITVHNVWNWGPQFDQGIISVVPPTPTGKVYPNFVSKVDVDGNEIAGVRLPPVSVPVATTAGWNHRATAFGGPDGCESSGLLVPFAPDQATRMTIGDPRLSLTERYGTHAAYASAVAAAAASLQAQRFLLPMDVATYITNAQKPITVTNNPIYGTYTW